MALSPPSMRICFGSEKTVSQDSSSGIYVKGYLHVLDLRKVYCMDPMVLEYSLYMGAEIQCALIMAGHTAHTGLCHLLEGCLSLVYIKTQS